MQFDHHPERAGTVRTVEPCKKRLVAVSKKFDVFNVVFHSRSSNLSKAKRVTHRVLTGSAFHSIVCIIYTFVQIVHMNARGGA